MDYKATFDDFVLSWESIFSELRSCQLTDEECRQMKRKFGSAIEGYMNFSSEIITPDIFTKIELLKSQLESALMKAKTNYREKHGAHMIDFNRVLDIIRITLEKFKIPNQYSFP